MNIPKKALDISEATLLVSEIGKAISSANAKTIKNLVNAMKDALTKLSPLLDENENDATEGVEEAAKILAQADSYDNVKYKVSSALRNRALQDAMAAKLTSGNSLDYEDYYYTGYPYIKDLYPDYVVYSQNSELYQCEYSLGADDSVTLGEPTPVEVSYVPTTNNQAEAKDISIEGDLVELVEKAVRDDGSARVKIISPGWGSSGYYSEKMLKRDGPKVFPKGLHMYINHPTEDEDKNRPERDLRDLAGVITSEVSWEDASPKNTGPGLYADVRIFDQYKTFIDQAAPHIGTSIRASGLAKEGEAEGRHGLIIDSLKEGYSVDYVTYPGRGGEILSLYESVRSREANTNKGLVNVDISNEELAQLRESAEKAAKLEAKLDTAVSTIASLQESLVVSDAKVVINETLINIEMPTVVRERLRTTMLRAIPLTETKTLDTEKLKEAVVEAAKAELQYIESVTGNVTNGRVIGLASPVVKELNAEEVNKQLNESLAGLGFNEKEIKFAAAGRIN